MRGYFVPGLGAPPEIYAGALPAGWQVLRPPPPAATNGELGRYVEWLRTIVARERAPVALGGHSMGAALAVIVASEDPGRVGRLLLVGPAGLPLTKPVAGSLRDLARQLSGRAYPRSAWRTAADALRAPRAAIRLVRSVRALDLRRELGALRASGIQARVVSCSTDTLTTPAHCSTVARHAAGEHRELALDGGHMWMLYHPDAFRDLF